MPARNRVNPFGEIEASPMRGAFTGNRGILHAGREVVRFHAHDSWVICSLNFKDRWHEQWIPHHFTWLYFQDEAVAFAAGHRPCAECRWQSYVEYRDAWARMTDGQPPSAKAMNRQLHSERLVPRTHRRRLHPADWGSLPDGTFVDIDGTAWLVAGDAVVRWTREGYGERRAIPDAGQVSVITPPSTVAVLRAGYAVQIDAGAIGLGRGAAPLKQNVVRSDEPSGPRPRQHRIYATRASQR